ncbi:mxaD protein [Methylomagnum ishizawai]|uniref:MxaD protein n=1 Tax=Methylomagnum ishizawai TaxID=1760988 RepID=A0A1Y6D865_9GAMM|nr:SRPBCC family protein [Methylomagnum ishizawai]SMF96632.1 mxaD protein [Methylomagnum ishizawai]
MLKLVRPVLAGVAYLAAFGAAAHGPTPQKVVETVEIAAPIDRVWQAVADFGGIAVWNPALKASEGNGNQPGAKRVLTFANGEKLEEDLDTYDPATHEYDYRMSRANTAALPASSYSVVFRLIPKDQGTQVEWKSRLYRGDTGNEPPPNLTDEAAVEAMRHFFQAGLNNLKARLEKAN